MRRVVIVGGGVAAQRCAYELRDRGFAGSVTLVSAEPELPYDRTLLSKDLLISDVTPRHLRLEDERSYAARDIDLVLGTAVRGVDVASRAVTLADGSTMPYDRLVLCTGGRAQVPAAVRCPGVLAVRELADAVEARAALRRARRVVVVGGGFIGAEVASAAVSLGLDVTIVEALKAPLAAALGDDVGDRLAAVYRAYGVDVRCGVAVHEIRRRGDDFQVALANGVRLQADTVIAGTGMAPATQFLAGTPLHSSDGIRVDSRCRTVVPGVLAAGDCASWWHPVYACRVRIEHWDTAARHGAAAAGAALGDDAPFAPVPYFWSDQYGHKLQWVGYAPTWDAVELEELGSNERFVARYRCAGRLTGVLAIDEPRAIAAARRELQLRVKEEVPACR